ncbi:Ig-like domain-containing protein, partial [Lyngbya sp. CCY1209]|nr:Ig-like domain-containing protein [Lyngbya sp. CCY1209]
MPGSLPTVNGNNVYGSGNTAADDENTNDNNDNSFGTDLTFLPIPDVDISTPTVPAATLLAGATDQTLYQLNLAVSVDTAELNGITFTPGGTYTAADIGEFELIYSTDEILDPSDTSLGTQAAVDSGNSLTFSGLTRTIANGATGYLFLTADIATTATEGHTLSIDAPALADINFAAANLTGTPEAGGIQTLDRIPTITGVTLPTNDTYIIGEHLDFEVTFSEAVTINPATGSVLVPLTLDNGGTVNATLNGDGSSALTHTFRYTVAEGNEDTDGITLGSDLTLTGDATIQDATDNDATLTLNGVGNTADVRVDGIAPTVTLTTDAEETINTPFTVTATFGEEVAGFEVSDITVGNGSADNLQTADNITYTFDVTPDADGEVTVDIAAAIAADIAGNDN